MTAAGARLAPALPYQVAALYIDPRGPYPGLVADAWDEARDARLYDGPLPIVAHPDCGPWGQLRHQCVRQTKDCAPRAVEQVRRWGGALEHPAYSTLFPHCGLPLPGELPDEFGGVTIEVEQVRWGHVARKRTWLYLVGVVDAGRDPPAREPTHWVSGTHNLKRKNANRRARGVAPLEIKMASAEQRRRTPVAFAHWLCQLAEQAGKARAG